MTAARVRGLANVAVAVDSLDAAAPLWERLGAVRVGGERVPEQKVRVAFYRLGDVVFELLESTDPAGPVGRFLAKRGPGLHHISIEVDDVGAALAAWKAAGVPFDDEARRRGAEGREVAFVHPKAAGGVLIEVVTKRSPSGVVTKRSPSGLTGGKGRRPKDG